MNVCFPDAVQVQLPCHSHQREQVIVLIRSFVRDKFLVAVPDPIVHPAVFQDVAGEDRFGLIGCHAVFSDSTGGLNVAVAVIHADDHEIFKFFMRLCTSLICLFAHKINPPSVDLSGKQHRF